jgi:hypothetical protein
MTLALRRPHLGQRSPLCEGGAAFPDESWVRCLIAGYSSTIFSM